MKKFAQSIIILIAAVAVFFTGTGVTIVNYCCSGCTVEQTLVMTKAHTCCSQKAGEATETPSCCSTHTQLQTGDAYAFSDGSHCKASRLSADIDGSVFRPHVSNPFIWISDIQPVAQVTTVSLTESIDNLTQLEPPPNILPREYLSLIRVLII